jgi:glycosyltransferase involved in cell wall biosynthesis
VFSDYLDCVHALPDFMFRLRRDEGRVTVIPRPGTVRRHRRHHPTDWENGMANGISPRLSVVIPAYNNGDTLDLVLDALGRQTVPAEEFEVIVGDDGSSTPLAPLVDKHAGRINVSCVRSETNLGRSANRNAAAARAAAPLLLMIDADNVPAPGLLARHLDFHAARSGRPGVLCGQRIELDWAGLDALRNGRPITPAMADSYRCDIRDPYHVLAPYQADLQRAPWIMGYSHNISIDRATFEALGGFDEGMVRWGFEDLEFFYRVFCHHDRSPDVFEVDAEAVAYHVSHYRRVPMILASIDNIHFFVRKHPNYDVEALHSLNPLGYIMGQMRLRDDAVRVYRQAGLGDPARLPAPVLDELSRRRALVIGNGLQALALGGGSRTFDHGAPLSETNWHLFGSVLRAFTNGQFEVLVNLDLWRFLPPEELWVLVTQGRKKAARLMLVAAHGGPDPVGLLPVPFLGDIQAAADGLRATFRVTVAEYDEASILTIE